MAALWAYGHDPEVKKRRDGVGEEDESDAKPLVWITRDRRRVNRWCFMAHNA